MRYSPTLKKPKCLGIECPRCYCMLRAQTQLFSLRGSYSLPESPQKKIKYLELRLAILRTVVGLIALMLVAVQLWLLITQAS